MGILMVKNSSVRVYIMKNINIVKGIVHGGPFYYTIRISKLITTDTCKHRFCQNDNAERKETFTMTEMTQKLNNIQLPPNVMRALGLETNWQKNISPELIEKIAVTAEKYKGALRRLSRY
jgi:hypothetical protein